MLRLLDLPALPGREDDGRPLAVVAADPWRSMALHAGPVVDALTQRAVIERPATVGSLVEDLEAGVRHRWDALNSLTVRVEGRSLRAQQGTEREMAAGAGAGALVVFLDEGSVRAGIGPAERGLALLCRAGPSGAPPGGAGFTALDFTFDGLIDCPWSPAHLRAEPDGVGGVNVSWIPRVRLYGDRWDGEPVPVDAARFRVRVLDAGNELRVIETEVTETVYPAAMLVEDFPGGTGLGVELAVCQWNPAFGWGAEAVVSIAAT